MASRQILKEFKHFKDLAFINGQWVGGLKGKTFPVMNPYSGEIIANVPDFHEDDINRAIDGSYDAFQKWRFSNCKVRSRLLSKLAQLMVENKKELAAVITLECGKPIQESVGEVNYAASFLEWFGEEAKRINGDVMPNIESNLRRLILKQPVGVCGMITPWNFPLAMVTRKVGAALAAGCSTVLKPSEETPLSALAFASLADDARLPPGLLNVITCSRENAELAGKVLCKSNLIKKITFTGSTAVGKWLVEQSASTMKRISMELGGNAPFIVFDSADPKLAAMAALRSRFRNTGQTCICAERLYVQEGIYDDFMGEFKNAVASLKAGDPLDANTTLSCVINEKSLSKIKDHVNDAKSHGGEIVYGGHLLEEGTLRFKPTVITNCNMDMKCVQQETFGPVVPIIRFQTEDEVLALANTENSGLSGYFFSNDNSQIWRVAEQLEVGMVGANTMNLSNEMIPFGGVKDSGIGREGSIYGINEYLELKIVSMQIK